MKTILVCLIVLGSIIPSLGLAQGEESTVRNLFLEYFKTTITGDAAKRYDYWSSEPKGYLTKAAYVAFKNYSIYENVRQMKTTQTQTMLPQMAMIANYFPLEVRGVVVTGTKAVVSYNAAVPEFTFAVGVGAYNQKVDLSKATDQQVKDLVNSAKSKLKDEGWKSGTSTWLKEEGHWRVLEMTVAEAKKLSEEYRLFTHLAGFDLQKPDAELTKTCQDILSIDPENKEVKELLVRLDTRKTEQRAGQNEDEKRKLRSEIDYQYIVDYQKALKLYEDYLGKFPDDADMKSKFPAWKTEGEKVWKKQLQWQIDQRQFQDIDDYAKRCRKYFQMEPNDSDRKSKVKEMLQSRVSDKGSRDKVYALFVELFPVDAKAKKDFGRLVMDYAYNEGMDEYIKWCKKYFEAEPSDAEQRNRVKDNLDYTIRSGESVADKKAAYNYYLLLFTDDKGAKERYQQFLK